MADSAGERTERATPKRRQEARKRGQVAHSRELSTAAVLAGAVIVLLAAGAGMATRAVHLMASLLTVDPSTLSDPRGLSRIWGHALAAGLMCVAPVFAGTLAGAFAGSVLLSGWHFSVGALRFDFSRVNPGPGIARMVSGTAFVELGKGFVKAIWIGLVAGIYLWHERGALAGLGSEPGAAATVHAARLLAMALAWLTVAVVVIAAIDAPFQLWSHNKRLRMTRQEVRDEHKQSEGRPEVKAKIRRLQSAMARRRMMQKIPTADVVVANPTHYAVALQYKGDSMRAPRVVAKGADEIAAIIRELAAEHRIPIVSAPPLARALYRGVELDAEIPGELYAAVARVLTYVYQLRTWTGGRQPEVPLVGDVPGGEPDPDPR